MTELRRLMEYSEMPGSRRFRTALVSVLAILVVLATIPGVASAKTEVGPTVVVQRGETISGDLTTAAGTVLVLGTVDGDVTALAGDVVVSGAVTGDVTALAGRIEVTGQVDGKVTAFGGVTTVAGSVGDGIDAIGGALSVSGDVAGTVDAIGVLVTVEDGGTVDGRLKTTAVRTQVNGTVLGAAGTVENQSGVGTSGAPNTAPVAAAATTQSVTDWRESVVTPPVLASAVTAVPVQILPFGISFLDAYGFLVNLLLGIVLIGILPRFSTRVASRALRDPATTVGFGLVTILGVPVVLVLLGVSLFGLPLALAGGALLVVLWWVGAIYGRFAVGVWLLQAVPRALSYADIEREPLENRWLSLVVGTLVIGLLVVVPAVGPVVDTGVALLGFGALARLGYDAYARTERRASDTGDPLQTLGDE